ncbi:MAG: Arc family DNA-binding protein [Gammaproteobacteria bacterium]|nr:Arc family DNA-binding protein [Gammaproteobacteria bacterium]MBU1731016.1 Arc family DNA-binding protein [Gammaproteobacteria bacterium]MBU1893676.1 Arc family DNA-binding protein [Gammaproteobacteria bacterium]
MKVRDIAPFGVRMPAELKDRLDREAKINGRSLNSEVVSRLQKSLDGQSHVMTNGYTEQEINRYVATHPLSDTERQMVNVFRKMPPEKQLALLSLFK